MLLDHFALVKEKKQIDFETRRMVFPVMCHVHTKHQKTNPAKDKELFQRLKSVNEEYPATHVK